MHGVFSTRYSLRIDNCKTTVTDLCFVESSGKGSLFSFSKDISTSLGFANIRSLIIKVRLDRDRERIQRVSPRDQDVHERPDEFTAIRAPDGVRDARARRSVSFGLSVDRSSGC